MDPAKDQQQFPPPPPVPPPGHSSSTAAAQNAPPRHPDETPLPDYSIPGHSSARDDIYNATPTTEHQPQFTDFNALPSDSVSDIKTAEAQEQEEAEGHKKKSKTKWSSKLSSWGTKAAAPLNNLANMLGSEGFLPQTMDKECDKAARILKSFCKDGIYSDATTATPTPGQEASAVPPATAADGSSNFSAPPTTAAADSKKHGPAKTSIQKPRVLLTIPSKVIARAQGLAIFTTVRVGFQVSGASGSGILIARLPDGSWSPPSGIQVHSIGAGFMMGLDIYDCVVVINSKEALDAFTRARVGLGSDMAVTAGPWGMGGALEWGVGAVSQGGKGKGKDGSPVTPAAGEDAASMHPLGAPGMPPVRPVAPQGQEQPQLFTTNSGASTPEPQETGKDGKKPSPFRGTLKPVYSYVKSRGFYAGVQVDGTVITERKDANAAFYGQPVSVHKILKGEVPAPAAAKGLLDVIKGAEGWRGQNKQQQGQGYAQQQPIYTPHQQQQPSPNPQAAYSAPRSPDITSGVQGLNISNNAAGPATGYAQPPPADGLSDAARAKAAEAAAEAAQAHQHEDPDLHGPPPPAYSEMTSATGVGGGTGVRFADEVGGDSTNNHNNNNRQSDLPPAYGTASEALNSHPPVADGMNNGGHR